MRGVLLALALVAACGGDEITDPFELRECSTDWSPIEQCQAACAEQVEPTGPQCIAHVDPRLMPMGGGGVTCEKTIEIDGFTGCCLTDYMDREEVVFAKCDEVQPMMGRR